MISPNFIVIIALMIFLFVTLKSIASVSAVVSIPATYWLTHAYSFDFKIAILMLLAAGLYSQLVFCFKASKGGFNFDWLHKTFFRR